MRVANQVALYSLFFKFTTRMNIVFIFERYDNTCQILMVFKGSGRYFCKTKKFPVGEINERSFIDPHPGYVNGSDIT